MNEAGAAETDTGGEKEGTESQAGVEADSEPSIPDLGEEFLSPESEGEGGRRMDVTMRLVLEPGMRQDHPLNKKVETEFHIDDFSKEFGLSSTGKSFVADVCGKRYNERTGIVRLVSERYELREDNFRDLQDKIASASHHLLLEALLLVRGGGRESIILLLLGMQGLVKREERMRMRWMRVRPNAWVAQRTSPGEKALASVFNTPHSFTLA